MTAKIEIDFLVRLVVYASVFFAFWFTGCSLSKFLLRIAARLSGHTRNLLELFAKIAKWVLIAIGFVVALTSLGVNVTGLLAGLGLTGFGAGLLLKDVLSGMISGISTLIYQPFKINDQVKIGDAEGVVVGIDLRYVTLQAEKQKILIPNAQLFTSSITIYQHT